MDINLQGINYRWALPPSSRGTIRLRVARLGELFINGTGTDKIRATSQTNVNRALLTDEFSIEHPRVREKGGTGGNASRAYCRAHTLLHRPFIRAR